MKYDELSPDAQNLIDLTYTQFADLFDNSEFGPFIEEFTPFSKDRLADLLEVASGNLMLLIKISGLRWDATNFPYHNTAASAALSLALTCEIIRHLMRSYVEIPDTARVGAPDVVRRDYFTRWQSVLNDYDGRLKDAAKKLEGDIYADEAGLGLYIKTLVDYPSMARGYTPFSSAERPMFGWFW